MVSVTHAFSLVEFSRGVDLVIVFKPLHSEGRRRSAQAHELAHVLLDYELRTIERVGSLRFLICDPAQEEEAGWLGGCLLLLRPVLLKAALAGDSPEEIGASYGMSKAMARFRLNASGVLVQVGRSKAARRRATR